MLKKEDYEILAVLSRDAGATTSLISKRAPVYSYSSGHVRSAWIRLDLLHLQKEGLVAHLDDQKPVCWVLTEAGEQALSTRDRVIALESQNTNRPKNTFSGVNE